MKVMFLDESGDHSLEKIDKSYPIFILAGCIFDFDYYINIAEPLINKLKIKYFSTTNIILRSYDIRKQKNDFSILVDYKTRTNFINDLNNLINKLDFKIISAGINKLELKRQYADPSNPYNLCFKFILERSIMFLGRSSEKVIFRAESRETHNNKELAKIYENFRKKGDGNFIKPDESQLKLVDLSFNQKSQNISGHQIADLIAYPIGKWILDSSKENKSFEVIKPKLHSKSGAYLNYGLKIFP